MDPEEQVNKSNQDVHVWRMNGGNNGESLILLMLLWGIHTFLALLKLFEDNEMLYIFFLFSQVGIVPLILLSDTCPFFSLVSLFLFFRGSEHLPLFISSYSFFFLSFFRALISWNNVASISQGKTEMFLAILSRIRSRIFLGGSRDVNGWIYADAYFRSRSNMYEWTCKWILILTTWQAPTGLHSLTTLNAHK